MRVLLFGAAGQLGQAFINNPDFVGLNALCFSRTELDICDAAAVSQYFAAVKPDVVINCAAYTAVDTAEQNKQLCLATNTDAVSHIAEQCQLHNALLIQFSTDFVFDGKKNSPYTEQDAPNPINHYGMSKWLAEQRIRQYCGKYLILRTSWLFSEYGHNFYRTMLKLAATDKPIRVISDQIGCPTYAGDVVTAVLTMINRYQHEGELPYGIFHLSGSPALSWYGFAQAIFATRQAKAAIAPISTSQWQATAVRPVNSALDCNKIRQAMGIIIPSWQIALTKLATERA